MIVFTICKNGGNAGVLGTSFSCVEMWENRAKNGGATIICFNRHLVVSQKIIRKVNDNDGAPAVMRCNDGARGRRR